MTEDISYPKWMYKPIEVPNLAEIQKELLPVLYKAIPKFENTFTQFKYISRMHIEPHAPLYTKFIDSLGILDKWEYSAIIVTNKGVSLPVHVDYMDWKTRCYGLNLPLINCEDTYTVFYDAELETDEFTLKVDPTNSARLIKKDTIPVEIGRWHANDPAWINIRIPHTPVSNHTKPRAVISARFTPELHSLLYK